VDFLRKVEAAAPMKIKKYSSTMALNLPIDLPATRKIKMANQFPLAGMILIKLVPI
jgi:hypothetical protein